MLNIEIQYDNFMNVIFYSRLNLMEVSVTYSVNFHVIFRARPKTALLLAVVRSLSVSFFIEKELHKQPRMKRKRKGEREEKETPPAHGNRQ
jgi:hypothetical protein